jgi:2',3'-cyclic-nucleotide 2'-phosphodiesterase (5'-nucleotidase family)
MLARCRIFLGRRPTDVAVTNGGGIRSNKIYLPGSTITRRDILAELPFGNRRTACGCLGVGLARDERL